MDAVLATVLEEKEFEGSVTQVAERRHPGSGTLEAITRVNLLHRVSVIACDLDEAKADLRVMAEAVAKEKEVTFDKRMLEVTCCPFRG